MRYLFFWCLAFLFIQSANCADYSFDNVPLPGFAAAVFKNGFNREYMIHPDVRGKTITLNVSVSDDRAYSTIEMALLLHGISIKDGGDIIYLLPVTSNSHLFMSADNAGVPELKMNPLNSPVTPYWGDITKDGGKKKILVDEVKSETKKKNHSVVVYKPRYREVAYLAEVVKFSGGEVMSDRADSSLLVYGVEVEHEERAEKINDALLLVDVPENSVSLHVVFIEITDSDSKGFTLSGLVKMLSGRFSVDFGASKSSGVNLAIKSSSVESVLSLLDDMVDYRYLAEPSLSIVHGKEAKLVIGSDVPLRGSIGRDSTGVTLQSVTYKTTGLQMVVKPHIYEDYVMVSGQFEVSSIASNSTSDIDSPLILRRSIATNFPIKDGEVIILGGLDDRKDARSRSGFLGLPFGSRKEINGSRIIILAEMKRGTVSTDIRDHEPFNFPRRLARDPRERSERESGSR